MDLSEAIRELRAHLGKSQEELAHELGSTTKTISRYENGAKPSRVLLGKLAAISGDREDLKILFATATLRKIESTLQKLASQGAARPITKWELVELSKLAQSALNDYAHCGQDREELWTFRSVKKNREKVWSERRLSKSGDAKKTYESWDRLGKTLTEILSRLEPWIAE